MTDINTINLDYIYFFYGLAFIILAAVCYSMTKSGKQSLPWNWLGLFSITHGVHEWLVLFTLSLGDTITLNYLRMISLILSFLFLTEFGRVSYIRLKNRGPGVWIYVPILLILGVWSWNSWSTLNAASRYLIGFGGGLWAVYVLYIAAKVESGGKKSLKWASYFLALYVLTMLIVPPAPIYLATLINQENFNQTFGIPIQLIRGILAIGVAVQIAFWNSTVTNSQEDKDFSHIRINYTTRTALTLIFILAFGWFLTEYAGSYAGQQVKSNLYDKTLTIESTIEPEHFTRLLDSKSITSSEDYLQLKVHLQEITETNSDIRGILLLSKKGKEIKVLVNSKEENTVNYLKPGSIYKGFSPEILTKLNNGEVYINNIFPSQENTSIKSYAPKKNHATNQIIGYVILDIDTTKYWINDIVLYRLSVIIVVTILSVLTILLFLAWQRNKESALKLADLREHEVNLANERKLRRITSSLGEGVYVLDEAGKLVFMNPEAERLLLWKEEELLGKTLHNVIHPHDVDGEQTERCNILDKVLSGKTHRGEFNFIDKEGNTFPVSFVSNSLVEDGTIVGTVTAFQDIRERKQAEESLKESESRYRTLFEKSANPIMIIDFNGNFIDCNDAAADFFECAKDILLTTNFSNTVAAGQEDIINKPQYFEEGGTLETEYFINGKIKILELTVTSVIWYGIPVIFGMGKDVSERRMAEEKIRYMAYHDALTGLPNRVLLKERINSLINKSIKIGVKFGLIFLDLDRFKTINDTLGHSVGDQVLQVVAARLKANVGEETTIARLGGDEFTILIPNIESEEEVATLATLIVNVFNKAFFINGREFYITTSIGITMYPNDGNDADTLLKNADTAMYHAKDLGKNNYQFYYEELNAKGYELLEMENNLRYALERQEFVVYYQPQIDLYTDKIIGMEALVRWNHPKYGLVSPMEFIPLAEETGLIIPLGEWVLTTACAQNKAWQSMGFEPVRVAVNISARQLQQHNFIDVVKKALEDTKLEPQFLEIEITETIAIQDLEYTIVLVKQLKEMGVNISIDDFGTGYSSLSYLKRFPEINALKIDRSFIRDLSANTQETASAFITTMIMLAQNLKLKVIAEGVETEEQFKFLKEQRCDAMQGFLISKPLPPDEFEVFLKNHNLVKNYINI